MLGIVVIGLNEGERLRGCMESLCVVRSVNVYVDSGSTDGSLEYAASVGCFIVHLDVSQAEFNCARARNAGFNRLMEIDDSIEFVQFVDADCDIAPGWLESAVAEFSADSTLGVLCGRLREKFRSANVYRRLCDMEWDGPVGDVETCGGIAMMRARPFRELQGFNEALRCGEEFELCSRFRAAGYRVVRIATEMAMHDAQMNTFGQWWKRTANYGHGYAAAIFRGFADSRKLRHVLRAVVWGGVLPMLALIALVLGFWYPKAWVITVLVFLAFLASAVRIYKVRRRHGSSPADARLYSLFCILSRWPQLAGQIRFHLRG